MNETNRAKWSVVVAVTAAVFGGTALLLSPYSLLNHEQVVLAETAATSVQDAFVRAAAQGDSDAVQALLKRGAAVNAAGVRPKKLYPVDEARQDRSFLLFRKELIRAVRRHDRRFLLSHLDPQIVVNPYGESPVSGIKGFVDEWRPEDPRSDLWSELSRSLSLGGSLERVKATTDGRSRRVREFVAPYVTSRWPEDLDPMDYEAIIARNVPVRARPSAAAPVIDTLSYDIVKVDWQASADLDWQWEKVTTPGGRQGYVAGDQIRSAGDTEAHFIKVHGRWRLTTLFGTWGE